MLRFSVALLAAALVFQGALPAWAAPPQWQKNTPRAGTVSNRAVPTTPDRIQPQCPVAHSGINGDMLPTGWETTMDKGQPAPLITSQVQGQYLYCVYQIPSKGRDIHASVRKLVPEEYRCETDGAGRFDCKK